MRRGHRGKFWCHPGGTSKKKAGGVGARADPARDRPGGATARLPQVGWTRWPIPGDGALSSIPEGQENRFEKRKEAGALRLRKYCEQIIPK